MNIANFPADGIVVLSMVTVSAAAFGTLANAKKFREAHPVKKNTETMGLPRGESTPEFPRGAPTEN